MQRLAVLYLCRNDRPVIILSRSTQQSCTATLRTPMTLSTFEISRLSRENRCSKKKKKFFFATVESPHSAPACLWFYFCKICPAYDILTIHANHGEVASSCKRTKVQEATVKLTCFSNRLVHRYMFERFVCTCQILDLLTATHLLQLWIHCNIQRSVTIPHNRCQLTSSILNTKKES